MERESKSARKREAERLQHLGASLVELNDEQLARVPLGADLRQAVSDYRHIKSREARRRQLQYIGRLMRGEDTESIAAVLDDLERKSAASRYAHSTAERWRSRLLEDDDALTRYVEAFPATDRVALRNLIREARRHPEHPARALFRFIRADQQDAR